MTRPTAPRPASRAPAVRSAAPVAAPPDEPQVNETYLQALYVVFWKPIYFSLGLAQGFVGCWLVSRIWAEPVGYAYAIAFLVSAPLAYVELEAFARAMRWTTDPIFPWRERAMILWAVGYSLALALAIGLAVHESDQRAQSRRNAEAAEREKERIRAITNSPSFKRGEEAVRAMRAAQEAREAKK